MNNKEDVKYTRCINCGVRIPEKYLSFHRWKAHGVIGYCKKCGRKKILSQYSHEPYCLRCCNENN